MKFEVCYANNVGYYIVPAGKNYWYLWKDGTLNSLTFRGDRSNRYKYGYWQTEEEAQKFLDNWLPREKLLTKDDVKQEAEKGDDEALACSIEHWKQLVVKEAFRYMSADYCAVCMRYEKTQHCVVTGGKCASSAYGSCVSEWRRAYKENTSEARIAMLNRLIKTQNERKNMKSETEIKLEQNKRDQEKLKEEQRKLEQDLAKSKSFKPGDVVICRPGEARFIVTTNSPEGFLYAIDVNGRLKATSTGGKFPGCTYRKIGTLKEFKV